MCKEEYKIADKEYCLLDSKHNIVSGGKVVISVVIPVYNTEKYIRKCLDSVILQTFSDWECIVVDDGSTDNSGTICDEYARQDSRFQVIHKQNGGVSTARNMGIDLAKGKYIAFLDGDDYVEMNFIEKMLCALEQYKVDMACCRVIFESVNKKQVQKNDNNKLSVYNRKESIIEMLLPTAFRGWPWNKVYKLAIIKNNALRFDETLRYCEDELFVLEYMSHINTCCYLPDALYHYVRNETSANNKMYAEKKFDICCLDRHKADELCFSIIKNMRDADLEKAFKARLFDSYMSTSDKLLATYNGEKDIWRMVRHNTRKYYLHHIANKKFRRNLIIEIKFLLRVISPWFYLKVFVK